MALEYSFGIGYKKFNIDDARNIARRRRFVHLSFYFLIPTFLSVIINLHRRVDKNRSIVLPTMDMVRRLSKHKRGEDIRKVSIYRSLFVPFSDLSSRFMNRGRFSHTIFYRLESRPRISSVIKGLIKVISLQHATQPWSRICIRSIPCHLFYHMWNHTMWSSTPLRSYYPSVKANPECSCFARLQLSTMWT